MNVEKHTAAEAAPDAPERTAQTEKTALILAPGFVSTNSATLQTCIRAREGKRPSRGEQGRRWTERVANKGVMKQKRRNEGNKRYEIRGANLSRRESARTRGYPPQCFVQRVWK